MKKLLEIICLLGVLCFSGCPVQQTGINEYQYMYDGMVDVWNSHASPGCKVNTLLGYGEYLYNSHLILFPRETPSTLKDYYFYWSAGIDCDNYAIYFTCELTENAFCDFSSGLSNFEITNGEESTKPIYDNEHFSLPTYLLQWVNVGEKWEVLEYVMLDDDNSTVVFVYTMSALEHIQKYAPYNVTPSEFDFLEYNFSIYGKYEEDDSYIYNDVFENCIYDISFIDTLK